MCPRMGHNVARNYPSAAFFAMISVALVSFVANACSHPASTNAPIPVPTATPNPTTLPIPQSRLELALSWVPLEYAHRLIEFSDHASSALATGVPIPRSYQEYERLDERQRSRLFEGTSRSYPDVAGRDREFLEKQFNYLIWEYNLGIWSDYRGGQVPRFMIFEGISDADGMLRGLAEQGFEQTTYNGTRYWRIYEDFRYDIRRHPMRLLQASWNRVAIMDNHILTAPATSIIENLIDVQKEESANLLESPPHLALSRVVGRGMIGGVFVTPDWIAENAFGSFRFNIRVGDITTLGCCEFRPDALDTHLTEPDAWDKLSPYSLALFGYRVQDGVEETVIALHYFDPDAARRDAAELAKRWNSFHLHVELDVPVADSCSPLSTRVEQSEESSVLLATCPVIRRAGEDETLAPGPDLWINLVQIGGKLEFLVGDLESHKERVRERAER